MVELCVVQSFGHYRVLDGSGLVTLRPPPDGIFIRRFKIVLREQPRRRR